jgi:hypothetical protein
VGRLHTETRTSSFDLSRQPTHSSPFGPQIMPFDHRHISECERRLRAARRSMIPLMSNTKWRKLFCVIEEAEVSVPRCGIKFLRDDRVFVESTPRSEDLDDEGTRDCFVCGPFSFRDIEWMEWPRSHEVSRGRGLKPWVRTQDIEALREVIASAGRFDIESTAEHLRVYGYRTARQKTEHEAAQDWESAGAPFPPVT